MSLDGGLEEVVEFFLSLAISAFNRVVFRLQLRDPRLQRGDRLGHRLRNHPTYFFFREPSRHAPFITDSTPWRNTNFSRKP